MKIPLFPGNAGKTRSVSGELPGFLQRLRKSNLSLYVGTALVMILLVVAVKGQDWAPHDPMQENYTLAVGGQVVRPPYPPFEIPGYPLGTDQYGRDLLSRMLWAIRPTLLLVGIVAAIRLVAGILLGLATGWYGGLSGRVLEGLVSIALAVPVLLVALMGITAIGIERGVIAFVFGMAITGWAETARLVSAQTRLIRSQAYVEAAQALGASVYRILFLHIWRQIQPLIWMLLAFEFSATLLLVAELGFLGYYIGGGVWIEISDFVTVNTTGLPELGQMLATTLTSLVRPFAMFAVGSVIFFAILGFNLLGDGLRRRNDYEMVFGKTRFRLLRGRLGEWIDEYFLPLLSDWVETHFARIGAVTAALLVIIAGAAIWRSMPKQAPASEAAQLIVPGGHLWASGRHDAQGSMWSNVNGPDLPVILWSLVAPGGLSGGPAVMADGNLVIASLDKTLFLISPQGQELWRASLPATPIGSPALGAGGEIYVADESGGLAAYSPAGKTLWIFSRTGRKATSGPIVASDGTIYYTREDIITAVTPQGQLLWVTQPVATYIERQPVLSAGESFIFLRDTAYAAASGVPLSLEGLPVAELIFTDPWFFVGADGKTYLRTGHEVLGWRSTNEGVIVESKQTWTHAGTVVINPSDQGTTPTGLTWLFYAGDWADLNLVWIDPDSKLISRTRLLSHQSKVVGVDKDFTTFLCASNYGALVNCFAIQIGDTEPLWSLELREEDVFVGGALVEGRLYAATGAGYLYAVGEK